MNFFTEQKQTHTENKQLLTKGGRRVGINEEFGIKIYTLLCIYIKWIHN